MIPKIIHYCWFGKNQLNDMAKSCIESWKKYCPDYEIMEWNEDNFDITSNIYVKEAYESKKWAFVTDYVRLYVLDKFGGIYMDTDVELLKDLDEFLIHNSFSGFETTEYIPTAIMGSVKGGEWIKYLLSYYDDKHFILPDGKLDTTTNVVTITNMTVQKYDIKLNDEFQEVKDILTLYPKEYFCPKDYQTNIINITDNTVCIHHFSASWLSKEQLKIHNIYIKYVKKYGIELANRKIVKWNFKWLFHQYGILGIVNKLLRKTKIFFVHKVLLKYLKILITKFTGVDNYIFFESEGDFCDNARALYEYLIANDYNKKYKIIWSVKNKKRFKNKTYNVKFVSKNDFFDTIKHIYYVNKSKYLFFTHPYWLTEWKKGQLNINLWHGIPIKGKGKDISNSFDILISTSKDSNQLFKKFVGAKDEQLIPLGMPRVDLLFLKNDIKKILKKHIKCQNFNKLILSMPTFRQGSIRDYEKFNNKYSINTIVTQEELIKFNDYLKQNNILLIAKIHHLQNLDFLDCLELTNILYLTDDDLMECGLQLYELIGQADCLLTDFSSVYFDFLMLDRPIGFFITDLSEYSRGFLVENPLDYMPGKKINSNNDLYSFIEDVLNGIDHYSEDRKKVLDFVYEFQDNKNCERIVEYLGL